MDAGDLLGLLLGALLALSLVIVLPAIVLRAAMGLYNKMTSATNNLPVPTFRRAIFIVGATFLASILAGIFFALYYAAVVPPPTVASESSSQIVLPLLSQALGFLVLTLMLKAMLPATFGKAALVALLWGVMMFAIAITASLVFMLIASILG